jgi:hypothetical protein
MKSKKLLLSTLLILGGMATYLVLGSSSGGQMGVSTTGCGGGGCHAASAGTSLSVTGIPAAGFTAGSTYTMTLQVINSTKLAAGFDLTVNAGTMSNAPANTMLMGGTELHHTSPQTLASGTATWVFNWTAPATGSAVTFSVAGNAVNNTGSESGDGWSLSTVTFNKAIPASVETISNTGISLYPNPANNALQFKSNEEINTASFTAVTLTGSQMEIQSNKVNTHEYQLMISSLPAGNYILHANLDGKVYSKPFTKQ